MSEHDYDNQPGAAHTKTHSTGHLPLENGEAYMRTP